MEHLIIASPIILGILSSPILHRSFSQTLSAKLHKKHGHNLKEYGL
jgi:hypothetical protein